MNAMNIVKMAPPVIGGIVGAYFGGPMGAMAGSTAGSAVSNLIFQSDYNKKQEQLQRESWSREDDAVLRRTEDLRRSGLSPVLAAGQAANAGGMLSQIPLSFNLSEAMQTMNLLKMDTDIAQTEAQTDLAKALKDKAKTETHGVWLENKTRKVDAKNTEESGIGSKSSPIGQIFKDLTGVAEKYNNYDAEQEKLNRKKGGKPVDNKPIYEYNIR